MIQQLNLNNLYNLTNLICSLILNDFIIIINYIYYFMIKFFDFY